VIRFRFSARWFGGRPQALHRLRTIALAAVLSMAWPCAASAATVSGFVTDGTNGEALPYANAALQGAALGAITNVKGFYTITGIPAGRFTLLVSYLGYASQARELTLAADDAVTVSVELAPQAIALAPIEVTAEGAEPTIAPSRLTLATRELHKVPSVVETDLFRAIQALPGVSTLSDFSSGLYVRGGSPDQNLILLDDVDVYNPSHLFGFFSTFNVDAVKTVELQKSGYPARYGGRLSSLLDVHNRDGNRKEFEGVGRASLISSSLTLEGPWRLGSWMLAGRRTYLELLAKAADIDLPYAFYDLHARVNLDPGPEDRTSLSFFRGSDRLDWDQKTIDVVLDWGNDTWSAQWTHLFNSRVFSHFVLGGSRFHSDAKVAFQDFEFKLENRIDDFCGKGSLSFKPSAAHLVDLGFEAKLLDFSWQRDVGENDRLRFQYDGFYGALYAQDSWEIDERWQVQPGLRFDYYSDGDYSGLGPRLSIRRWLNPMTAVHATYGRYHQYLNLVAEEGLSFADMWFPVDATLDPGTADHYILGVDIGPYEDFDLTVEAYYKDYRDLVEFSSEYTRSLVDEDARLGDLFNSGTGEAYGGEIYLRNRTAGFDGWIGYSYGIARRHVELFNRGEAYTPVYDRRHQITVMQTRPLGRGWMLDLSFRYGSGQPTTLSSGRATFRDLTGRTYDVALAGPYNDNRLPAFHRLDLGLSRLWQFKGWSLEPNLQIINLYNRDNVYIRTYDLTANPATYDDVTMLPLIPTIGVNVRF
jgi:hypothetical protein